MLIPNEIFDLNYIIKSTKPEAEIRLVGGFIRDNLLGLNPIEIDLSCNIPANDLMLILQKAGVKTIPTGLSHGTITAVYNHKAFEITNLRRDISCDGRRAQVDFTNNWEEDAARRDFSINAFYLDLNNQFYDYFDGRKDLTEGLVKFIGDPITRIREDYLRLLRYFRCLAYFHKTSNLDKQSLEAAITLKSGLEKLSMERVKKEVLKLLSLSYPVKSLQLLIEHHILDFFWTEELQEVDKLLFSQDALLNFTALLYKNKVKLDLKSLKMSGAEVKRIEFLLQSDQFLLEDLYFNPNRNQVLRLSHELGFAKTMDLVTLASILFGEKAGLEPSIISKNYLEEIIKNGYMQFPLRGLDLKELGFHGPEIGLQLQIAKRIWLNSNCSLGHQSLIELLKNNKK